MPCIDTVQGFYFCPTAYQPRASVYSGFSVVHAQFTTTTPKPFAWLYSGVSVDLTHSSAHNAAATQADYTPTAPRWRAYPQAQHLHQYQRYHRHAGRCTGHSSRPIIIRYIRVQLCAPCYRSMPDSAAYRRPCQPGGVSMLPTPCGWSPSVG